MFQFRICFGLQFDTKEINNPATVGAGIRPELINFILTIKNLKLDNALDQNV